jgi:hypothetical protein
LLVDAAQLTCQQRRRPLRRQQHDPSALLDPRLALARRGSTSSACRSSAIEMIGVAVGTFRIPTLDHDSRFSDSGYFGDGGY